VNIIKEVKTGRNFLETESSKEEISSCGQDSMYLKDPSDRMEIRRQKLRGAWIRREIKCDGRRRTSYSFGPSEIIETRFQKVNGCSE